MTRPNLVIAHWAGLDFFGEEDRALLDQAGHLLDPDPIGSWDDPRADDLLAEAQVIVGHWGCPRIDSSVLDRAPGLGLFAYAAGTVKGIVSPSVFERGIRVTSGAAANAEPVAEFTVAAILLANKDVFWRRDLLRDAAIAGHRPPSSTPVGNWAKTIGIVGASLVGRRVIELLRPYAGLRVTLYDPYVTAAEAEAMGVTKLALDELCASADVLSIHAPDLPETRGMIGAHELAALRSGATVVNTARGVLIDQAALTTELERGRLYAILDVTDPEPLPAEHRLLQLPNAFVTPHLAGSEGTELGRMTEHVTDEIRRWSSGEPAANEVTAERLARMA